MYFINQDRMHSEVLSCTKMYGLYRFKYYEMAYRYGFYIEKGAVALGDEEKQTISDKNIMYIRRRHLRYEFTRMLLFVSVRDSEERFID